MRTSRLVIALLLLCGLVVFALQNTTPAISIAFLGWRTPSLSLAVWLFGAIALGALTTLALAGMPELGTPSRQSRRRWQVRNDIPRDRPPAEPPRDRPRPPDPRPAAPENPKTRFTGKSDRPLDAGDDWQTWEQRSSPDQWEDWSQAPETPREEKQRLSKRQRRAQEQAEASYQDLTEGWDPTTADDYLPKGGSVVEDTLDEISEGWDDWEEEEEPESQSADASIYEVQRSPESVVQSGTSYAYRYRSAKPADATVEVSAEESSQEADEWEAVERVLEDIEPDTRDDREGVYDANYRVITPPYQALDEDEEAEEAGDRPAAD